MKTETIDFLLYSYFGIVQQQLKDKDDDEIIEICAKRAYRDLSRTLDFKEKPDGKKGEEKKRIENDHTEFRNKICTKITAWIHELLESEADQFDVLHRAACDKICKEANCEKADGRKLLKETFFLGQAQKWLNMTMKYMWLLGLKASKVSKLLPVMHVPVDSYIMEAAAKSGIKHSKEPWSKWNDYDEYLTFQNELRKLSDVPLKWEASAWIKIAQDKA